MKKLLDVLRLAQEYLAARGVESSRLNAERLLADVLDLDRLELYLQFDRPLNDDELAAYREHIRRRGAGEPLQYVLGRTDFRGLTLRVGPGVLIPRPETEQLVDLLLRETAHDIDSRTATLPVLDVCAGSGVVGLSLAAECEGLLVVMAELDRGAAGWAAVNLRELDGRLSCPAHLVVCDLFSAFRPERQFAVVASNPPYVSSGEMAELPGEIAEHEPRAALEAGDRGLDVIERIIAEAPDYLRPGGLLALEIGETQAVAIERMFAGPAAEIYGPSEFHSDLADKPRFVTARRK